MAVRLTYVMCGALACGVMSFVGCKTSTSSEQSVDLQSATELSAEEWTSACQKELDNPVTGSTSKKELMQVANTTDCAAAYPAVKKILEQTYKKTS